MPGEQELLERLAALETELRALKSAPAAPDPALDALVQSRRQQELNRQALHRVPAPAQVRSLSLVMGAAQINVSVARRALAVYRLRHGYWPDPQRLTADEARVLQRDAQALAAAQPLVDWPPATPPEVALGEMQQEARQMAASLEQAEGLLAQLLTHMPHALRSFWEQRYGALKPGSR